MVAGMSEMIGMFGGAAGEATLAQAVHLWGWRHTLVVCAGVGLGLSILMGWVVRNAPPKQNIYPVRPESNLLKTLLGFKVVLRFPQAWWNGLVAGLCFASLPAFAGLWAVPYLQASYHFDLGTAGLLSGLIFAGTACGCPFWGWLTDKIGRRKPVIYLGNSAAFCLMLYLLYGPQLPKFLLSLELLALGFISAVYVVPFAIMRDISPPQVRGMAMGFVNMMSMIIGAPLLQPLIGLLLRWFGQPTIQDYVVTYSSKGYQLALTVLPFCLLLSMVVMTRIQETYCQERECVDEPIAINDELSEELQST